jgi:dethiobiotin synthetase
VSLGRIVLVGTGTGIGKTHVAVSLVRALARAGREVAGLKPVESGVGSTGSDAEQLAQSGTFHVKHPPPYALAAPLSPHLAARLEGLTLALPPIVAWVDSVTADWLVIETAGALLSPLAPGLTNLDVARALAPTALVLVATDRLGVLHEVTAALLALRVLAPELPEPVIALQPPMDADASTGGNAAELMLLEIARSVVSFPRANVGTRETQAATESLLQALGAAGFEAAEV